VVVGVVVVWVAIALVFGPSDGLDRERIDSEASCVV